ncbi:hypothetical protein GCM10010483_43450 [Actinokineospora diospyrosa]
MDGRCAPGPFDLFADLFQFDLPAGDEEYGRPAIAKHQRGFPADAARGAGDDDSPTAQGIRVVPGTLRIEVLRPVPHENFGVGGEVRESDSSEGLDGRGRVEHRRQVQVRKDLSWHTKLVQDGGRDRPNRANPG